MPHPEPPLVAIHHPGTWPLGFGPYATGGVIHYVDPATAERLLARGFKPITDPAPVIIPPVPEV